jgi:arabinofuranan 3-O-arabinosyltransferase
MSIDTAFTEGLLRLGWRWARLAVRPARLLRSQPSKAWPPMVAYGMPVALSVVAVQLWFRGGGELASGDLTPPIAPGTDFLAHWNDTADGAGSPSFSIVSLPYFEGLRLFHTIGLGEAVFQRVWLTLLVAGAAAAVVFLTRSLFRPPLAAAGAGVVSLFNAYRLVVAFDWVPIAAMLAAGVLGGLLLRQARAERGPNPVVFAVASLALGPVFVNPPHLALVLVWIAVCVLLACAVHGRPAFARVGRFLLRAVPLALLFNLWWIVPACLTLTGSVFAQQFTAPGIAQWAWTHQRASIPNVLSLTSSWAWLRRAYFPFSPGLERLPFNILKFAPAAAATLAVYLARGRACRIAYLLSAVGLVAAWVMKGIHPPLGGTNLWLYHHLPGFWLFREPVKVGLVLVLVYSLLAALAVVQLSTRSAIAGFAGAAVIVGAVVAYAHPLLTGAVVAGKRPLLPPAHVRVPSAWSRAAVYVDGLPAQGKAVILPELDYYQAPTTWGYYGASFFHQLFRRPLIEPLPGGYFSDPVVTQLVGELQQEILGRADVRPVLHALGARFVLLRRDLKPRFPGRVYTPPSRLARALAKPDGLRRLRSFGVVDVYEGTGMPSGEVYPAEPLVVQGTTVASMYRPLYAGTNAAFVAPDATRLLDGVPMGETALLPARPVAAERSLGHNGAGLSISGNRIIVRLPRLSAPLRITVGHLSFVAPGVHPQTRTVRYTGATAPTIYRFLRTDRTRALPIRPELARHLGDCNAYDARTPREVGLSARVLDQAGLPTLRLGAVDHSACVAMRIRDVRPTVPFHLHLAYRPITGDPPRLCVWETGPNRCATLPGLLASPGWHSFDTTVTLDPGTSSGWLFLYADGGGSQPTATEYRDLRIELPQTAIAVGVSPVARLPQVRYERVAPYEFRVHVRDARKPFLLTLSETFAPGWQLKGGDRRVRASHLRVNGYANGWRVPWRGSYDLELTYGPEQPALWARRGDAVLIPLVIALSVVRWGLQRRRGDARTISAGRKTEQTVASTAVLPVREVVQGSLAGSRPTSGEITGESTEPVVVEPPPGALDAADELRRRAERTKDEARAQADELRRRTEESRAELASEIESLHAMATEMRESMRTVLRGSLPVSDEESRPEEEPSLTDDGQSRTRGPHLRAHENDEE